jgi:putative SOS response-associated peptidase YedK
MDAFFENVERGGKNAVLQFVPKPPRPMFVGEELVSFAAITDEPPPEVAAAGHDRCVVNLKEKNVQAWLTPEGHSMADLQAIIADVEQPYYEHEVMAA